MGDAEGEAIGCDAAYRVRDTLIRVTKDVRTPPADQVNEAIAVSVPDVGTLATLDQQRRRSH